jgi:hypothetical protein
VPDDEQRKLTELGVTMCRLLFSPNATPNEPWDGLSYQTVDVLTEYCRQVACPIKLQTPPPSSDHLSHTHEVSKTAVYLKALSPQVARTSWTDLNRVHQYAFYSVFYGITRIPFKSLISIGVLLYNLPLNIIREFFGGSLTPFERYQIDKWCVDELIDFNQFFPEVARISGIRRNRVELLLRKAQKLEEKDIDLVFCTLSNLDADYLGPHVNLGPHVKNPYRTYEHIINAPFPIIPGKKGGEDRHLFHRRSPDIEQKAEHLILCTECGGIGFLYDMYKKSLSQAEKLCLPQLQLHVPDYFPRPEREVE